MATSTIITTNNIHLFIRGIRVWAEATAFVFNRIIVNPHHPNYKVVMTGIDEIGRATQATADMDPLDHSQMMVVVQHIRSALLLFKGLRKSPDNDVIDYYVPAKMGSELLRAWDEAFIELGKFMLQKE